jgi:hypothetical protein
VVAAHLIDLTYLLWRKSESVPRIFARRIHARTRFAPMALRTPGFNARVTFLRRMCEAITGSA